MTVFLFVGPSLSPEELGAAGDFVCLPPAAQGDVQRAAEMRPRAIGLIDGYFEGVPSVWHKEILWAMTRGIHLFGSASMGALRAAELHSFGMQGVGRIFQDYLEANLEDDDEVAVLHGPAEVGYLALSEAMVNIRATLESAEADGVIAAGTRFALERHAKSLFYQERNWDAVFTRGGEDAEVPAAELADFRDWLPLGRVDLKAKDARAMLSAMQAFLATDPGPFRAAYDFEWTDMWDTAIAFSRSTGLGQYGDLGPVPPDRLLDELRLDCGAYARAKTAARARHLSLLAADRRGLKVERPAVKDALGRLRGAFGLYRRAELDRWMAANDLTVAEIERLMEDEARLEAAAPLLEPALDRPLLDHLRVSGAYQRLADRAKRKQAAIKDLGLSDPEPVDLGLTPIVLALWYFEKRLGQAMPDDLDAFSRALGLAGRAEFYRLIAREYLFLNDEKQADDEV